MANRMWVDPPGGWRYGFPKVYDPKRDGEFYAWLIAQGYPADTIDSFGGELPCSFWAVDDEPTSDFKKGISVKPNRDHDTDVAKTQQPPLDK